MAWATSGSLDLIGRRLRCAMRDSLGFDPERGDPLYKNWPFL
jgi:alpha-glucosidase